MFKSYIIGGFAPKAISMFSIAFIIGSLSSDEYVLFDYIMVTSGIALPLISLCLVDAFYHFAIKSGDKDASYDSISHFINFIYYLSFFVSSLFVFFDFVDVKYLLVIIFSWLQFKIYLNKMDARICENNSKFLLSELIPAVLIFVLCFFLSIYNARLVFVLGAYTGVWFVTSLIFSKNNYFYFKVTIPIYFVKYSLPLIPNAVISLLILNLFRYLESSEQEMLLYSLNYRVLMFFIVVSSIIYMYLQDMFYKQQPSLIKFLFTAVSIIILSVFVTFISVELIKPYYLGEKINLFSEPVYLYSVVAMTFLMLSGSLSVLINYISKPIHNLYSNCIGFLLSLVFVAVFHDGNNELIYAYAALLAYLSSFCYRFIFIMKYKSSFM
ncbi:hypothetical protein [Moritella yayanosii]|uniref:Uncharacterized protein n=1 Tax=Moritella yayanosii TaxID=69539 RepID=A0A330LTP9_9GAMM|nr:hypothetical protein [Moritella yayanosii]SQD80123.1 membrane protein of unknown function, homologue to protein involved in the export of O-antigen and teichoic acid [Moritella yayanosii]